MGEGGYFLRSNLNYSFKKRHLKGMLYAHTVSVVSLMPALFIVLIA